MASVRVEIDIDVPIIVKDFATLNEEKKVCVIKATARGCDKFEDEAGRLQKYGDLTKDYMAALIGNVGLDITSLTVEHENVWRGHVSIARMPRKEKKSASKSSYS